MPYDSIKLYHISALFASSNRHFKAYAFNKNSPEYLCKIQIVKRITSRLRVIFSHIMTEVAGIYKLHDIAGFKRYIGR